MPEDVNDVLAIHQLGNASHVPTGHKRHTTQYRIVKTEALGQLASTPTGATSTSGGFPPVVNERHVFVERRAVDFELEVEDLLAGNPVMIGDKLFRVF